MNPEVSLAIHRTSAVAAGIAAVLSPIPLADELLMLPVCGVLARRIARANNVAPSALPWRPIWLTLVNSLVARGVANLVVAWVPGVAAVANAASAVMLTEFFGRYVDEACTQPAKVTVVSVASIAEMFRAKMPKPVPAPAT